MTSILLVKTSSMGDVIHNLPVVSDIQQHRPGTVVDWVVEESFAELPRMHPGVGEVIEVAVRRWRKTPFAGEVWRSIGAIRRHLRKQRYDLVLDTQGLLKSALIARMSGARVVGLSAEAAREPLAARFYHEAFAIPRNVHAVERNRWLAAAALGYDCAGTPDYGIRTVPLTAPWLAPRRYAVLLHGTSRADKEWPEEHWIGLGRWLASQGIAGVLPWGSRDEEVRSRRLAAQIDDAVVPPRLNLADAAGLMAGAALVVGTDTGLTHLAAALARPVIALFVASDPTLTGVLAGAQAVNLGTRGMPPAPAVVREVAQRLLDEAAPAAPHPVCTAAAPAP